MDTKPPIINPIKLPAFCCIFCNITTDNKKDYERHTSTSKHIKRSNMDTLNNMNTMNNPIPFTCKCGKTYKYSQGLSKHKSKCAKPNLIPLNNITISLDEPHESTIDNVSIQEHTIYNGGFAQESNLRNEVISVHSDQAHIIPDNNENMCELIKALIQSNNEYKQSNTEFKQLVLEQQAKMMEQQAKMMEIAGSNNTNINSHNTNTYITLPVFLNNTCKDAITMNTFANSIQPSDEQILYTAAHGAEDGIFSILEDKLKSMDITERPFHCTDIKRHTMHVKNDNGWELDQDQNHMKKAYKSIIHKNSIRTGDFIKENPKYQYGETGKNFHKLIGENDGGLTTKIQLRNEESIINKLCKKAYIDKHIMTKTTKIQIQEPTI